MTLRFYELPIVVRLATFLSFFMAWVLFAELVIDRHGLDRSLPYYRVGNLCPYDAGVAILLLLLWLRLNSRPAAAS